jgi:hypothetical protein
MHPFDDALDSARVGESTATPGDLVFGDEIEV